MTKKELLARIEELERRVAKLELEKQAITISTPIFPQPPLYPSLFGPAPIKWGYDESKTALMNQPWLAVTDK